MIRERYKRDNTYLRRAVAAVVALTLAVHGAKAAGSPWDAIASPHFRHFSIPKELPTVAMSIVQDSAGYIWMATQEGLIRWDGYHPKIYRHDAQDRFSLPANVVSRLVVDEEGTLFAATEEGTVARYEPQTDHFITLPPIGLGVGIYTAFISDGEGGLWLGNANGLSHWSKGAGAWERVETSFHAPIWSLLRASDGTLWAGTEHGLFRRRRDSTDFFEAFPGAPATALTMANIRSLLQSRNGEIWLGTNDGRLGRLSPDGMAQEIDLPRPSSAILSLAQTVSGSICAGMGGTGLAFVDAESGRLSQIVKFDPMRPDGLVSDFVTTLFVDRSGGLWVGHLRGADYLAATSGTFQSLLPSDRNKAALASSNVAALSLGPDGKVWLGTDNGADLLDQEMASYSISHLAPRTGTALPAALIHSIATTPDGHRWLGTAQGLFESDGKQLKPFTPLDGSPIRSLATEKDILWIGTDRQGLFKFDTSSRTLTSYRHDQSDPQSLSDNFILGLLHDPSHGLWISTSHGLNLFDGKSFYRFLHDPADPASIPSDVVGGLSLDRTGRLWIGTEGAGAAVLEGEPHVAPRFRRIGRKEGLQGENVGSLMEDDQGRVWIGTDVGISEVDTRTLKVRNFTSADGLSLSSYFPNASIRLRDGTLLFGAVGGVTVIHPEHLTDWTYRPEIVATSARIGQHYVQPASTLVLPPDDHNLQVEFSALDYSAPDQNSYAYMLQGFDKDWTVTDADHRLAAYTNLPPGKYTLLLRGTNHAGLWTDPPTRLNIRVLPAWYQTLWFKLLLAACGAAAVAGLVRSRTSLLRRRQKELEAQVAERTAEIASLLHNSGEGFLSFGPDLVIDRQYSRACEAYLGEPPAGKDAAALLFAENPKHVAFVTESVPAALCSTDRKKQDLILSLLPKEIDRRGRRLKTRYAVLENGHLMVVLRDVTTERRLTERVASEHRRLGMIVSAVTDSRDFFELLASFKSFIASLDGRTQGAIPPATALDETYRQIHTYKGEFNQFSFERVPALLHDIESRLDDLRETSDHITAEDLRTTLAAGTLLDALELDLAVIHKALGGDFLAQGGLVTMTPGQAAQIKALAKRWHQGERVDLQHPAVQQLLADIDKVGKVSLKNEIATYDQTIAQVALRLDKEIAPLTITGGEDIWIDPDIYGRFLRSLIHVFRNCVVHGIESPEKRVEEGKDEFGQISCFIEQDGEALRIVIADDGAGLDIADLRRRIAGTRSVGDEPVERLSDQEVAAHIFLDHVSTSAEADQWAGRGVGLAAVRQEVEALGGTATVETLSGRGARFIFTLKMPLSQASRAA